MSVDVALDVAMDEGLAVDSEAADALFRAARTANTFTDEPVSDQTAQTIYELAKMGPTAFNCQPMRVTYVRSAEARERLVAHMARGNREKTLAAPLTAILSFDPAWHEQWDNFLPAAPRGRAMFDGNDELIRRTGYANAHMQAGYFIMAVRAAGLAAGPMTGYDAAGLDAEFFPAGEAASCMVVNIGKPGADAWGPQKPRFAYDEVVTTV